MDKNVAGRIKNLKIQGLHEQFDVDLDFNQGLNILYGKNGRGKTTVLHVLANALEMDFKRFDSLSFRQITLRSYNEDVLEIHKTPEVGVHFNREPILFNGNVLEEYIPRIKAAFGETPTYLPAFRSILERMRDTYYRTDPQDNEFDELMRKEFETIKIAAKTDIEIARGPRSSLSNLREEAHMTVRKTMQCRQWFGAFIPTIRYPSIAEVTDGLLGEWREAQLEIAQREQNMFADVFVKVFRTIVGIDAPSAHLHSANEILAEISNSLISDEDKESNDYQLTSHRSNSTYLQLSEALEYMEKNSNNTKEVETSVLNLYLETLARRKLERKSALQKSRDFENSINKFLDNKKLRIGSGSAQKRLPRGAVSVESIGGHSYSPASLSSGEKQVLTMLYSASRSKFKTGLFLIDEPELSLHVDWQRIILKELIDQSPNRQILVCTHSPEVGADHFYETKMFNPAPTVPAQDGLFSEDDVVEE